ncbi:MAG: rhodanese-like domain-containing protein [Candidatus Yonathbacteria bacterium]|nr:rhodanese-like domain-containing protein [Candidatus Yonathbacteria bacterium]
MKNIDPKKLNELLRDRNHNEVLVDVREPSEYKDAAIPGAENIPLGEIGSAAGRLKKYETVYVNCGSGARSKKACEILEASGINVVNLEGGLAAWLHSGFAVRGKGDRMPIIRQVMLTAGLLVLVGVMLALFVHPYFLVISVVVGAGLTFSGASGYCLMANFLEMMPWNK